jgi:hypothetical protein
LGELPTLPPSMPGLRLARRLHRHLRACGVQFEEGYPVDRIECAQQDEVAAHLASPGRGFQLRATSVLLATRLDGSPLPGAECAHRLDAFPEAESMAAQILAGYHAARRIVAERSARAAH